MVGAGVGVGGVVVVVTGLVYSSSSTTNTNIKAAGAVDREYANSFFIRRPFVVLS